MTELNVGDSYDSVVIGDRFQLVRPATILARTASVANRIHPFKER